MEQEEFEVFDETAVYNEKISPLIQQLVDICAEHKIPWIASFTYAIRKDGEEDVILSGCTSWAEYVGRCTAELAWAKNLLQYGAESAESRALNALIDEQDKLQKQLLAAVIPND